jgi:hypothetical protein
LLSTSQYRAQHLFSFLFGRLFVENVQQLQQPKII